MSKRFGLTVILFLLFFFASAQQKWNYIEIDKKSYELFQQKKWDELIKFNDEARDHGIDYFYLQARTGIAYYNLKRYRKASRWFFKAWENDQSFDWLQEYLYYSLVFGGRVDEALKFATGFTKDLQQKIHYADKKITRVGLESGYAFNPDYNNLMNENFSGEVDLGEDYGEAFILKNYFYESFDLSHQVAPGVKINHNINYINLNREELVDWGSQNSFPAKTNQFQYFINTQFVAGKKWYISPSVTAIAGNTELFLGTYRSSGMRYFYSRSYKYSDFVFSLSTWSHFGNFSPGAEINQANIYNTNFTQLSAWLTVYPFSNINFYFTPKIYLKTDSEGKMNYNTYEVSGGLQLGPIHLYGKYLNGDMENLIESAGYVVSNFPGHSKQKIMGSLYFPAWKKHQFVIRYINQDITEKYQVFSNAVPANNLEYKYMQHTIIGGISWNF
jgi:hypothetical protein